MSARRLGLARTHESVSKDLEMRRNDRRVQFIGATRDELLAAFGRGDDDR